MNIGGPNFISNIIANHFFEGKTREESLESLTLSHLAVPNLYPPMDLFTVNYYYNMLERGMVNIVPPHMPPPPPVQMQQPIGWPHPGFPAQPGMNVNPFFMPFGVQNVAAPPGPVSPLLPLLPHPAPQPLVHYREGQQPVLTNMNILPLVFHELCARDQRKMVRVCKLFSTFVEGENRIFELIRVIYTGNSVIIHEKSGFNAKKTATTFHRTPVVVDLEDENAISEEEQQKAEREFIVEAIASFTQKVEKPHTKVEKFVVNQTEDTVSTAESQFFFEKLAEGMGERRAKLQVSKILITSSTFLQMNQIIGQCHVGTLKKVELELLRNDETEDNNTTGFEKHTKYLTDLFMLEGILPLPLVRIASIENLIVNLHQPRLEEAQSYKQIICSKSTQFSHLLDFGAAGRANFYNQMNPEMLIHDEAFDEDEDPRKPVAQMPRTGPAKGSIFFSNISEGAVKLDPTEETF